MTRAIVLFLLSSIGLTAQAPPPPAPIRHFATRAFTLVVKADGTVVGWGRDPDGQAARPPSPKRVLTEPTPIELPGKAVQVALGESTQYALLEDGTVVAWGTNDEGQLGNGPVGANGAPGVYPKPSITPVRVTGLTDVVQIAAGMKHVIALKKDGTVWAWGRREYGAIGDGKPAARIVSAIGPTRVKGADGITQIAADGSHNLALRQDGRVLAWGSNDSGELGNGTRDTGWSAAPVSGLENVVAIAAGTGGMGKGVSGAVRADGTVWMWGTGSANLMGNGSPELPSPDDPGGRVLLPVQVKGIIGVKSITIGSGHAGVVLGDGTVRLWGFDGYGQIGVGTSGAHQPRPMKPSITNVARLYLGGYHSAAVRSDGTLWIWGNNFIERGPGLLGKNLHVPTRLDLP